MHGAGIRLVRMGMPIPFSAERARHFARGLSELFVVEEKSPNIESLLTDALYNQSHHPRIVGKADEQDRMLLASHGALTADELIGPLRSRLRERIGDRLVPEPPQRVRIELPLAQSRSPYFCSGCPHNRSTVVPDGSLVGAGIGCHTMALLMDPDRVGDIVGLTCMGQEGTQWVGMEPFVETRHIFQNLGDGTYFHSGQLAITGAVAAGSNITYKLLWNRAVAMTGGQDPAGQLSVPDVAAALLAGGVAKVLVTTDDPSTYRTRTLPAGVEVWSRDRLDEAQELLAGIDGVTVLIHDQQCAAEARRHRKRGTQPTPTQRVVINERICEGCGDCGDKSNCLSVQPVDTPFGRKTRIDQTTCNLDYSCLDGDCPSFMTVIQPGPLRTAVREMLAPLRRRSSSGDDASSSRAEPPAELPAPVPVVGPDAVSVRMCGIGGTGVVTVNQVLGTAAMFDGFEARGLDQIGLSQKAGTVVGDLRFTRLDTPTTARLGSGQADVILAFDLLVAASAAGLDVADPQRTVVVGSISATPTGAMVADPTIDMPAADELTERVAAVTRADCRHWADVSAIVTALCGSAVTANVFVVGMATQAGALPLTPASIEAAIELNGVAVAANLAAFRWGRTMVAEPALVEAAVGAAVPGTVDDPGANVPGDLAERVESLAGGSLAAEDLTRFVAELCAYQSSRLAMQYLDALEPVARADRAAGDGSRRLTAAAAAGLFKLTAYKDEYEVARLMCDPAANAVAADLAASSGGVVAWKLHPPVLRALGRTTKVRIGMAWRPVFALLGRGKRLRGRWFDPFGHTEVRRTERALRGEYLAGVGAACAALERDPGAARYEQAVAVAGLADEVRGYEDIKMASVERFRTALAERVGELAEPD